LKRGTKIAWTLGGVLLVAAVVAAKAGLSRKETVQVETQAIVSKDLAAIIQASGKIRPKTMVDVSAAVSGKVLEVAVKEGDTVKKGQLLLRIDPKPFQTQVEQLEASIESGRATLDQAQANLKQERLDRDRLDHLYEQQLVSLTEAQKARTTVEVEEARVRGAEQELHRMNANLSEARHELSKVDVISDIDGVVVELNIEAGENAFVGAFNNPATVLLAVADLNVIEAEVEVDETEGVRAQPGQTAEIEVDAHPGWLFHGRVSEVGHSPLKQLQTGAEREGTAFKVKISVLDTIQEVRPGLTCSAKIRTTERKGAVAVPIQALTLRKPDGAAPPKDGAKEEETERPKDSAVQDDGSIPAAIGESAATTGPKKKVNEKGKVEGVFVVADGVATFRTVAVGITGEKDFEVLSGLAPGDRVVVGPFKALRTMKSGDKVKEIAKKEKKPGEDDDEPEGTKPAGS
jgi:HlyD family secretion protein